MPRKPRTTTVNRQTRQERALHGLQFAARALAGHPVPFADEINALAVRVAEQVAADWEPAKAPTGPLEVGEQVVPLPKHAGDPEFQGLATPFTVLSVYESGDQKKVRRCTVKDANGTRSSNIVVSKLRRATVEPGAAAGEGV